MKPAIDILVLAAGASSRMGDADKLLELVDGEPLLAMVCKQAVMSAARQVFVALTPDRPERMHSLQGLEVQHVNVADASLGMSASIKAGLQASDDPDGLLIALADMPEITTAHLNKLITTFAANPNASIVRAASPAGIPGHPVIFAKKHFDRLRTISGDVGGQQIIQAHPQDVVMVELEGGAALTDLDTPQSWADWRARTGR